MTITERILNSVIQGILRLICRVDLSQLSNVPEHGPLIIVTNHVSFLEVPLIFTHLRIQKRMGYLILLSAVLAVATLGLTLLLAPRLGIAAGGLGWLAGNGLVAALAVFTAVRNGAGADLARWLGRIRFHAGEGK